MIVRQSQKWGGVLKKFRNLQKKTQKNSHLPRTFGPERGLEGEPPAAAGVDLGPGLAEVVGQGVHKRIVKVDQQHPRAAAARMLHGARLDRGLGGPVAPAGDSLLKRRKKKKNNNITIHVSE
jgi:hypothetical protein